MNSNLMLAKNVAFLFYFTGAIYFLHFLDHFSIDDLVNLNDLKRFQQRPYK